MTLNSIDHSVASWRLSSPTSHEIVPFEFSMDRCMIAESDRLVIAGHVKHLLSIVQQCGLAEYLAIATMVNSLVLKESSTEKATGLLIESFHMLAGGQEQEEEGDKKKPASVVRRLSKPLSEDASVRTAYPIRQEEEDDDLRCCAKTYYYDGQGNYTYSHAEAGHG